MKSKTSDYGSRGGGESSGKMGDQESESVGEVGGGGKEKNREGGGVEGEGGGGGGRGGDGSAAERERGGVREGEGVPEPEAVTSEEKARDGVVTETVVEEGSHCDGSVGQERAKRDRTSGE